MKDSMKMSVAYQFAFLLLIQLAASAVALLFGVVAFGYFLTINVAKQIVTAAFMIMNFAMLYIYTKKFSQLDNKPYTPLKPSLFKGVMFGVVISAVNVLLLLAVSRVWKYWGDASGIQGVLRTVVNAVVYIWTFPYEGIMDLEQGHFTMISAIMSVILPIAATTAGYIAGKRHFELAEKIDSLMYEKDEK